MEISVSSVTERDLDLLLLEEFAASSEFALWFADQVGITNLSGEPVICVRRSVTTASGESDLEVALRTADASTHYLLIENKVGAGLQIRQAERYAERGEAYVRNGECSEFTTTLVAPEAYSRDGAEANGFQATVTYEAVRDWYRQSSLDDLRAVVKMTLLSAAIDKSTLGYQPVEDKPVTDFWREYWILATEAAPELEMSEPIAKPAGAGFVTFRPPTLPRDVNIVHKLPQGVVDLQFAEFGPRLTELRSRLAPHLDSGMNVARASKSGAVRLNVPVLDTTRSFDEQTEDAREGLAAALRLLSWHSTLPAEP